MNLSDQPVRVVLVSPGDVPKERAIAKTVVDELNRGVADGRLLLWRWETDLRPGLHPEGPQGAIDKQMEIETADIVIGVFWKRFGTPTQEATSGTEHELRRAWTAWQKRQRPEVMVYFCTRPYAPRRHDDIAQWQQVLQFKEDLPREQLWWDFKTSQGFRELLSEHLTQYLVARDAPEHNPVLPARRTRRAEDPKKVAVMHGRDLTARRAIFDLLRRLGLDPLEWAELVDLTEHAAPYNGEAVAAAFATAQAVIVLLTPDDVGYLHPELRGSREREDDRDPTGQARLNVILEAGMALQSHPTRTVLVEIGHTREISDLAGRNTVRLDGQPHTVNSLATRLERAGCPVRRDRSDWLDATALTELAALTRGASVIQRVAASVDDEGLSRSAHSSGARRQARHLLVECSTSVTTVRAALENDRWWDVRFEGLPASQWNEARDLLADEAPHVYDAVAPAYVTADQTNKAANHDYAEGAIHLPFDNTRRQRLERLREQLASAATALRDYCGAESAGWRSADGSSTTNASTTHEAPKARQFDVGDESEYVSRDGSVDESMAAVVETTEDESPDAIIALAERAYRESSGKMNPLLDFLADNPERTVTFAEASEALGFTSARSMPGLLGAFGRRANHRYDGKWPFKTMLHNDAWHMRMTQEAAQAIRDLRSVGDA